METLLSWFDTHMQTLQRLGLLWFLIGLGSLVVTVVSLPLVILQLPRDYFVRDRRLHRERAHPLLALLGLTVKNLIGLALVAVGAIMLFVPGQGILTMLIGLLLMNFPGKYRLERKLVSRPAVLRALNRVRRRWNREPLLPPPP